ncbi:MAG: sugar ABC transporter permease [Spirochaetales bacterium]|nr:sugar ABC transporter permease [Spirochaetales bacterium]
MKKLTMEQRRSLNGFLFISVWLLGFMLFLAMPLIQSLWLSFNKLTNIQAMRTHWIGGRNYYKAFFVDTGYLPRFWNVIWQTVIKTPLITVFSIMLAILLNREIKARGLFRAMFFLPMLLGTGFVMRQLIGSGSPTEALQSGISIPEVILLYLGPELGGIVQKTLNFLSVILWRSSVQIILFLSGLQGIPDSFYEAARCDGASVWEEFWKITLPMLSPVIVLNVVYTLIDSFSDGTNDLLDYIVYQTFDKLKFGYGAALGWIYFAACLLLVVGVFFILSRFVVTTGEK